MREKIEKFLEEKKVLTEELKLWVVNKSIPLEERWDLFFKSKLGTNEDYIWDFETLNQEDFHDSKQNRYETLNAKDVIYWANRHSYSEKEIIAFKEEVLENFINSWKFDW